MVLLRERRRTCAWTALLLLTCQHALCGEAIVASDRQVVPPVRQQQQQQPPFFLRLPTFISASPLVSSLSLSSAACGYGCDANDDKAISAKYLDRIGISRNQAMAALVDPDSSRRRSPDLADLQQLLTAHLFTVPFENLDQHSHPADDDNDDDDGEQHGEQHGGSSNSNNDSQKTTKAKFIPRKLPQDLPTLDVKRSLDKICHGNRGGFCYELKSFAWLLRSLGFQVRLAVADVGCAQAIPAHVIILVDGLLLGSQAQHGDDEKDRDHAGATPAEAAAVLVDVGFGTPGICNVVLPLLLNEPVFDTHGDSFRFVRCTERDRFDTALYRTRVGNPNVVEPMYRFCSKDDFAYNAKEFALGLNHVLNKSPTFTKKRLCVLSTETGHCTLGEGYVKWVERGKVVDTVTFGSETEWRWALSKHFGVVL